MVKSLASAVVIAAALAWAPPAQAIDSTLAKIRDGKVLKLGHRHAATPFSFVDDDGTVKGYTIDLCLAVAEGIKKELALDNLKVEYVALTAEERFDELEKGEIDILCGPTTWTLKRQETMSFSLLTYVTGMEMLVHEDTGIGDIEDLAGHKLGVVKGTTSEEAVIKGLDRHGIEAEVIRFEKHDEVLAALEGKEIDAYFADRIRLLTMAKQAKDRERLIMIDRFYSFEPYALAMPRDALDLKLIVDTTLANLYRSREIMEIFHRWFEEYGVASNETIMRAVYKLQAIPEY